MSKIHAQQGALLFLDDLPKWVYRIDLIAEQTLLDLNERFNLKLRVQVQERKRQCNVMCT